MGHGACTCDGAAFEYVVNVDAALVHDERLDGSRHQLSFDFAMLLSPLRGADLVAYDRRGEEITATMFAPFGFMKVNADYTAKSYEDWRAED
jgi:sulfide:quinone oxidoreductase